MLLAMRCAALAVTSWVLAAPDAAAAWPEIGANDFRITFEGGTGQSLPSARLVAAAFHPERQEYFVVYIAAEFENDLEARRLQADGTAVSGSFFLANASDILNVALAYSPVHDHYLVIWWQADDGFQVLGRLVSPEGAILSSTLPIVPVCSDLPSCTPSVVYNPTADEFLVVWGRDESSGEKRIMGQRLDGESGAPVFTPFEISGGPDADIDPDVAYDPQANQYLVVWTSIRADDVDLRAQRLDGTAAGQIGEDDFVISDMSGRLGEENYGAYYPKIAYNPLDEEFLVVWWGLDGAAPLAPNGELEIFGQRISADGSEVGPNDFRISDAGGLGTTQHNPLAPQVAFLESEGLYLVSWHGTDSVDGMAATELEVFGQFLTRSGTEVGPNDLRLSDVGGFGDPSYAAGATRVVAADAPREFLVLWTANEDLPGMAPTENEVYGQRLDGGSIILFYDGFESADTSAWSSSLP
ncbi:MAG: hypothetical protein DWQ36_18675 [Acidobacteria bacterium]|nr:MAG: hypothetical protein DWQ30_11355 [Acidobacteriota bacterium]REK03892.1 MAG: hypothetical protein DWQ36_18675 [Acidobacteriota bacterium]